MEEVRNIVVAGRSCLAVASETATGWRVAGYYRKQTVAVEDQPSKEMAFDSWKRKVLCVRTTDHFDILPPLEMAKELRAALDTVLDRPAVPPQS